MSYTYDVKIGKDKATIGNVSVADWGPGDDITGGDAVTTTENAVLIIKMLWLRAIRTLESKICLQMQIRVCLML